jgi:hypothetical protein
MKICKICQKELPKREFYFDKSHNLYYLECKKCHNNKTKQYNLKNRELVKEQRRQCRLKDKEKRKQWKFKHKDEIKEKDRQYRLKNKDKIKEKKKQRYQNNKNNKEKTALQHQRRNEHRKQKRKIDINYKLQENLRHRIWCALKKNTKSKHTMELIGCSIDDLKLHLERQFAPKMSWENYGKNGWHVDHIIPCCCYNLTDSVEQQQCFHFTNLQPLWQKDNLEKYNKII